MNNNNKVLDYTGLATLVSLIRNLYPLKTDVEAAIDGLKNIPIFELATPVVVGESSDLVQEDIDSLVGLYSADDGKANKLIMCRVEDTNYFGSYTYNDSDESITIFGTNGNGCVIVNALFDELGAFSSGDVRYENIFYSKDIGSNYVNRANLVNNILTLYNGLGGVQSSIDLSSLGGPTPLYEITITTDCTSDTASGSRTLSTTDFNNVRAFYTWAQSVYTKSDYYLRINLTNQSISSANINNVATIKFNRNSLPDERSIRFLLPISSVGAYYNNTDRSVGELAVVSFYTRWSTTATNFYWVSVASGPFGWKAISNYALARNNTTAFTPTDNSYQPATAKYVTDKIAAAIAGITTVDFAIVQTLPTQDISTSTIYLVPKAESETGDVYDEWIYINSNWEHIGSTTVDLSSYYTKSETYNKTEVDNLLDEIPATGVEYDSATETLFITSGVTNGSEEEY